jgi:PhoH-like ATPase
MKKYFVLDTNVLLHDPEALFRFKDNVVVVPIQVIEEIDHFKKELSEIGRSARTVSRYLDALRMLGSLADGVRTEDGGTIQVHLGVELPANFPISERNADAKILALALALKQQRKTVVFITKDTNLRVKADAIGVSAVDFESQPKSIDEIYKGWSEIFVKRPVLERFFQEGGLAPSDLEGNVKLYPNQFVRLTLEGEGQSGSALGRYHAREGRIALLRDGKPVWGIRPRNMEQRFAMDLLLDDSVALVSLMGKAGTGKTLLALAAGLLRTVDEEAYRKLLVTRPIFPLGRDLGYLPGEIQDKLKPWMQPIFDNLELLVHLSTGEKRGRGALTLLDQRLIEIEPLTYIRGRSIPQQFLIVDESQNLTPHEIKTILTRAGEKTKVILTGDPYQIDNPYVDAASNGLSYTIERFKGQEEAGSILFSKGERSPLAELASNLL